MQRVCGVAMLRLDPERGWRLEAKVEVEFEGGKERVLFHGSERESVVMELFYGRLNSLRKFPFSFAFMLVR